MPDPFIKAFEEFVEDKFFMPPEQAARERREREEHRRRVHQGCGVVLGHGESCQAGYYCGRCDWKAKAQAAAVAAGWPVFLLPEPRKPRWWRA